MSLTPQSLADAMENSAGVDYTALFPAVNQCLIECGCTTVDRAAMWFGQVGEESGGLRWMEEIADGSEYEGRDDLGNTEPGDGPRFKGRGPIQVTGRDHYTVLSQWAFGKGLVPSPTFFVDNPSELSNTTYGFIGVTWYWTTQRPMNDAADARDIVRATKYVNGGTNGLDDRTQRWQNALGMGDAILPSSDATAPKVIPRPDFTEVNQLGNDPNKGNRGGDVPTLWLIHTQEGGDATAQDLAVFLKNSAGGPNPVSYHYTIDNSVTVIDVVDTDLESWSVLDANAYSINLCFAGSTVNWSTQEWMDKMGNAIDVAAYLAVQDCIKYGIPPVVIPPPYHDGPGISDHKFVTQHLGIGSHIDVGPNFPWTYFAERVAFYVTGEDDMPSHTGPSWSMYRLTNDDMPAGTPMDYRIEGLVHEQAVEAEAKSGGLWEAGLLAALEAGHMPASDQPGAKERVTHLLDHSVPAVIAAAARKQVSSGA